MTRANRVWTDAMRTDVWQHRQRGRTHGEIVAAVNEKYGMRFSINALVGVMHRWGFTDRRNKGGRPRKHAVAQVRFTEETGGVPWNECVDDGCHWPVRQGHVCGKPASGSYCAEHRARARRTS